MTILNCIDCKNVKCFLKLYCSVDDLIKISSSKSYNWYKKGEFIFKAGDSVFGIYFIHTGGIKVVTNIINNRQQIVRFGNNGHVIGFRGLGSKRYYFNAIAMMDTSMCFIESALFEYTCMNNPVLAYKLMIFFADSLRSTELRVKNQAIMNIREKVAEAFLYTNEIFGYDPQYNTLNVELTRQDIGNIAGTTSEQVTRQLHDFESEKIISKHKRAIHLDIEKLEHIVRHYRD